MTSATELPQVVSNMIRTEALGSCNYRISVGQMSVPCPCDRGLFESPSDEPGAGCKKCAHQSSHHEGTVTSRTPREATVQALWNQLEKAGVVHIRGTPGSGKSTLAHLLQSHVQVARSDIPVHHFEWPTTDPNGAGKLPYESLLNHTLGRGRRAPDNWWNWRGLLIVDEAQRSYKHTGFWNDIVKNTTPGSGPIVALFSSYEPPSRGPPELRIPVELCPSVEVSLQPTAANPGVGLSFSRAEFDDVLCREFGPYSEYGHGFDLDDDLKDYLWHLTSGHPAGVRTILDGLASSLKYRDYSKNPSTISMDDVLDFLANDSTLIACVKNNIHRSKF